MNSSAGSPAPGWYPDAARAGLARWWDGSAWTEHSVPLGAASPSSLAGDVVGTAASPVAGAPEPANAAPQLSAEAQTDGAIPLSRRERRALDARVQAGTAAAPIVPAPFIVPSSSPEDSVVTPEPVEGSAWAPVAAAAAPPALASAAPAIPAADAPAALAAAAAPREASTPSTVTAAQLAAAAPPIAGTATPAAAPAPDWPVLSQLAAAGSAPDAGSVEYAPLARSYASSAAAPPHLLRHSLPTATFSAWALALLPLVIAAALAAVVMRVLPDPTALLMTTTALLALGGIGIGALAWTILFAALDSRRLRMLGHIRRPSVLWAVLLGPFAYFLARIVALRGSGRRAAAPLLGHIAALLLAGVGAGVAVGAGAASLTTVSPIVGIESSLEASLAQQGMPYSVMCPSGIELAQGAVMTCEARDDIGVAALVEVTITDPAGAFSYRMV